MTSSRSRRAKTTTASHCSALLRARYEQALVSIGKLAGIKAPRSLYPVDVLPTIKADLFAVNQMVGTWDSQCAYEGQPNGNILQVSGLSGCGLSAVVAVVAMESPHVSMRRQRVERALSVPNDWNLTLLTKARQLSCQ